MGMIEDHEQRIERAKRIRATGVTKALGLRFHDSWDGAAISAAGGALIDLIDSEKGRELLMKAMLEVVSYDDIRALLERLAS